MQVAISIIVAFSVSVFVGYMSALITRFLDSLLDYGMLLGRLRYALARYYARDDHDLQCELTDAALIDDFAERMDAVNTVYWKIAARRFWFTGWVCIKCFAARVCVVLYALSALVMLNFDISVVSIFVFSVSALAFCFHEIQRQ